MGEMHPAVVFVIQAGAVATALIAIGALIEKWWSPLKRWLQDALTNPVLTKMDEIDGSLRERDDKLAGEIEELRGEFRAHRTYVGAHLGPEADENNAPLFERVGHLELQSSELAAQVEDLHQE